MNTCNFTGIRMKKADWKAVPAYFRKVEIGKPPMILSGGRYQPVLIVD